MENICITNLPAGIDSKCFGFEKPVKNIVITGSGFEFASIDAAKQLSNWQAGIQALDIFTPQGLASYENDGEEPKINTTAYGEKFVVQDGVPSMKAMIKTSFGDFLELMNTLRGGQYRVFFVLTDGNIKGHVAGDGTFKGYTSKIYAYSTGIGALDAPEGNYPVHIMFSDYSEFLSGIILPLTWNANIELPAAMPFGLSLIKTAVYDTGTGALNVLIAERGSGNGYTGLVVTDFEVLSSSDATAAITAANDGGNGKYTLTIDAGANPLTAGTYVKFRVKKGSPVTAVSNIVEFNV